MNILRLHTSVKHAAWGVYRSRASGSFLFGRPVFFFSDFTQQKRFLCPVHHFGDDEFLSPTCLMSLGSPHAEDDGATIFGMTSKVCN